MHMVLRRVLHLVENFVDAEFDRADLIHIHCILADVWIVVQDELELLPEELLGRATPEATAFEEEPQR